MDTGKRILVIAGPNGAGKTTFAREFLPNEAACPTFVNADLIAARLSPSDPDAAAVRAGRLMLQEINALTHRGESFAFETTRSGRGYVRRIRPLAAGRVSRRTYLPLATVAGGGDRACCGTSKARRPRRAS
jgi:predicted ABC-type ATPase